MRVSMLAWMAVIAGCGGKAGDDADDGDTTPADADTDTDADTDADTDTLTDTSAALRDGVYTGIVDIHGVDSGFAYWVDDCSTAISFTVDLLASPQITGSASCTFTGALNGQTVELELSADITVDPDFAGDSHVVWGTIDQVDPWMGRFTGADEMQGAFQGIRMQPGGIAYTEWSGTFTATR